MRRREAYGVATSVLSSTRDRTVISGTARHVLTGEPGEAQEQGRETGAPVRGRPTLGGACAGRGDAGTCALAGALASPLLGGGERGSLLSLEFRSC